MSKIIIMIVMAATLSGCSIEYKVNGERAIKAELKPNKKPPPAAMVSKGSASRLVSRR